MVSRRNIFLWACTGTCLWVSVVVGMSRGEPEVLMREDFDTDPHSGLAAELLVQEEVDLAEGEGPDGSDAIRVAYVGYERGSQRVVQIHHLPGAHAAATLSFDVRFEEAFQFVKGGKLHGFGSLVPVSGGQNRKPQGWSARLIFETDGFLAPYVYDQDPERKWGRSRSSSAKVFVPGRWHHVVFQVQLNDPGQANGWVRIFVDDREILKMEDIAYRAEGGDASLIRTFLFSTFHGGSSAEYSPVDKKGNPTTVYAWFDNFIVIEGIRDP